MDKIEECKKIIYKKISCINTTEKLCEIQDEYYYHDKISDLGKLDNDIKEINKEYNKLNRELQDKIKKLKKSELVDLVLRIY